jgi:predicted NAD-dependent protein-ADP-ribosyltransferase YbiA (DUF1768 family)
MVKGGILLNPKFVLKTYDKETKIIIMDIVDDKGNRFSNREKKGMTVDEFKNFIREKYPNAIIENKIVKHRERTAMQEIDDIKMERENIMNDREIKRLMRNDWED